MNATRRRSLWTLGMVVAIVAGLATASSTSAQQGQPTLTGEILFACHAGVVPGASVSCGGGEGSTVLIRARCDATTGANGTITWTATGQVAFGPYPGTFSEAGTAVFTNQQLTSVDVTFSVDSPSGARVVEGRKFILAPTGVGFCSRLNPRPGSGFETAVGGSVRYEATITPETGGSFHDEGASSIHVSGFTAGNPLGAEIETTIGSVNERFTSDFLFAEPICPPNDDDDGDGLTNHNESAFSTLRSNSDSDSDGIADGNDDANGNGEDDEDEDDDENDGCPDEDSDDDGEDDEDEDDDEEDDD